MFLDLEYRGAPELVFELPVDYTASLKRSGNFEYKIT